jgi:hypothetical protein
MAITQVGIVYSTALRTIRRVIIPNSDAALNDGKLLLSGESLYKMALATYNAAGGLAGLQAALAGQVGPAGNDLCAVCNGQNQVAGVVRADTSILTDEQSLPNGYYMVQGIPTQVQTGTYTDALLGVQPIYQTITAGWFYNPNTGNFGLTRNP